MSVFGQWTQGHYFTSEGAKFTFRHARAGVFFAEFLQHFHACSRDIDKWTASRAALSQDFSLKMLNLTIWRIPATVAAGADPAAMAGGFARRRGGPGGRPGGRGLGRSEHRKLLISRRKIPGIAGLLRIRQDRPGAQARARRGIVAECGFRRDIVKSERTARAAIHACMYHEPMIMNWMRPNLEA